MKKIVLLLGLVLSLGFSLQAQEEEEKLDVEQFKKEIEQKLETFQLDITSALQEMESAMGNMMFENDGNIIINGDTIIVAPGGELPEGMENFGELFRQIPEAGGDGFQFFFGGEEMDAFSQMFDQLKGQLGQAFDFRDFPVEDFSWTEEEKSENQEKSNEKPNNKKEKKEKEDAPKKKTKKRKTYSL